MTMRAPKGYVLKKQHDGHLMDGRGFRVDEGQEPRKGLMPDGAIEVFWYDEDEPFVWRANDGMGPNASEHAKDMARAGTPLEGWAANGELKPIKDGWFPPVYTLHLKEEAPK
jgi:hypothetical protein